MTTEYQKPLPRPVNPALTQPFWDAAKRHELNIQRCTHCDHIFFYPREACPRCLYGEDHLEWVKVSGLGRIYTYTIVHQPANQAFLNDVPYVFAIVQLDEGPRIPGNLIGLNDPHDCHVNMRVKASFDDVTPDWTLIKWEPA